MNESFVTVCGNVVADPQSRTTKQGKVFASFRVASTTRRWDQGLSAFVDGSTNFVNVVGFNALGANVMGSLKKGDPVIVYGRLRVNQYQATDGTPRTSVEVDAHAVGHNLTRGLSALTRLGRPQGEPVDRLADPVVTGSFDEDAALPADPGSDGGADVGPDVADLEEALGGDPWATGTGSGSGAELREEDADTDAYVVTPG